MSTIVHIRRLPLEEVEVLDLKSELTFNLFCWSGGVTTTRATHCVH